MIDRFTRWPEAVPIPDINADTVATTFYTNWVTRFGAPAVITTDRGSQFESQLFQALTKLIGCKRTRTTAYHPASNGMIERWHRSLKTAIMCHNTSNWTEVLPTVLLGLRTSYKEDVKATAAELVYGQTLRLPGEFFVDEEISTEPQIFIEKFREHMRKVRATPTAHHSKRKAFTHKTLHTCTHVFVRVDAVRKPLEQPYEGPYKVIDRPSDYVFMIDVKGQPTSISTERLKPAFFEVATPESDDRSETTNADITEPGSSITASSQPVKTYAGPKKRITFAT